MSTQTFDDRAHPRATDGKVATKDVAEAAGGMVALAPAPADDLTEILGSCSRRVQARLESPGGPGDTMTLTALRLRGVAAAVRMDHPEAKFVQLEVSDSADDVLWVADLADADRLSLTDYSVELSQDEEVSDLLCGVEPHLVEASASAVDADRRRGIFMVDLDAALAAPEPVDAGVAATARAEAMVDGYRTEHTDLDKDEQEVAREMLGDLNQWASARGIDLTALLNDTPASSNGR
ncbi:hypothetical protein [Oerskovia merdavium]|uniref:Uncharacterized protein n=1 Tax=Oerskovia merdavium TaxID=2762227 RepID=A0ABR8U429_9CELL|nr:hypothetical protein [Oerskovia merdavium]MBD7982796.1 hypothetical protein [Oerskovia merdavium]